MAFRQIITFKKKLKMKRNSLIILLFIWSLNSIAQSVILSYDEFLNIVKENHPLIKIADINVLKADAELLSARGMFDSKLEATYGNKIFESKEYYNTLATAVKVPTWFGVELQGGLDRNTGYYVNPENQTPQNGLLYAGFSVNIGKGLFIDERRATLKQAKINQNIQGLERKIIVNDLLYQASTAYWDWYLAYNDLRVVEQVYFASKDRLDGLVQLFNLGDKSALDTLEASIQVQNRLLVLQESKLQYNNSKLNLNLFLWVDGLVPVELNDNVCPSEFLPSDFKVNNIYVNDSIIESHPELSKLLQLNDFYLIEKRLAIEGLKPELKVKYNPYLSNTSNLSFNNYKLGAELSYPLFLRKDRGKLKLTNYKIEENDYKYDFKYQSISFKYKILNNEKNTYLNQYKILSKNVINYNALYDAEKLMFNSGESSLFRLNSREMNYMNARLKQIEYFVKLKNVDLKIKKELFLEY